MTISKSPMRAIVAGMAVAAGALAQPAFAKDIIVQMKSQGANGAMMVFEPALVKAKVGDTIHFVPTDPGHNAEIIAGFAPAGVTEPSGAMGKEYVLTLSKPGLYGVKCKPHFSMGMVALVKAGAGPAPNAAAAAAVPLPPLAAKRMVPMLAQAK